VAAAGAAARLGLDEGFAGLARAMERGGPGLGVFAARALAAAAAPPPAEGPEAAAVRSRAASALAAAAGSGDVAVAMEAVKAIARLRPPEALRVLDALEPLAAPGVRGRLRLARAAFGGPEAADQAERALGDPSPAVRAAAAEILGGLRPAAEGGRSRTVGLLEDALGDRSPSVRVSAAYALGMIGGGEAERALEAASSHEDPALRAASLRALALLRARRGAGGPPAGASPGPGPPPRGESAAQGLDAAGSPGRKGGFTLEGVVTGAGGEAFCMLRGPDGRRRLLRRGDDAGGGYAVESVSARGKGGGRVVLKGVADALTLKIDGAP
jgi:HEAT repeat protein